MPIAAVRVAVNENITIATSLFIVSQSSELVLTYSVILSTSKAHVDGRLCIFITEENGKLHCEWTIQLAIVPSSKAFGSFTYSTCAIQRP